MIQQYEEKLYKNSAVLIDAYEKEILLYKWIKRIKKQLLVDLFYFLIFFGFIGIFLLEKRQDIVDEIARYLLIIVFLYPIMCGLRYIVCEIKGYVKSQKGKWIRMLIYIIKNEKGKLEICFVQAGQLCQKEIMPKYREIRGEKNTFATLIYFQNMEQYMLLKDTSWIQSVSDK